MHPDLINNYVSHHFFFCNIMSPTIESITKHKNLCKNLLAYKTTMSYFKGYTIYIPTYHYLGLGIHKGFGSSSLCQITNKK